MLLRPRVQPCARPSSSCWFVANLAGVTSGYVRVLCRAPNLEPVLPVSDGMTILGTSLVLPDRVHRSGSKCTAHPCAGACP